MLHHLPAFSLLPFFSLDVDCYALDPRKGFSKKHLLPSTAKLLDEEEFSQVYLGWNEEGIFAKIHVDAMIQKSLSDFRRGDSVEFFFDMRNVKSSSIITAYHHHFVFFPQTVTGLWGKEVTRFSGDEMHALCSPQELKVLVSFHKKGYVMEIEIPGHAMHGYDPSRYDQFGFTYRINRFHAAPQHFSMTSDEYVLERNPQFWANIQMRK
ncbi:MAG: hypothetical protein JW769_03625 [Parachlamydiales bacterium]|nr:hypothetical protein [Parachlamydiales bacterium]